MFEVTKLNDSRIIDPLINVFVNEKITQLYGENEVIGSDTQTVFIESVNDLYELGVFDDDGIFIEVVHEHLPFNCLEVYLATDTLLIIPDAIGANELFNGVIING
jgi:hypothetical protein